MYIVRFRYKNDRHITGINEGYLWYIQLILNSLIVYPKKLGVENGIT